VKDKGAVGRNDNLTSEYMYLKGMLEHCDDNGVPAWWWTEQYCHITLRDYNRQRDKVAEQVLRSAPLAAGAIVPRVPASGLPSTLSAPSSAQPRTVAAKAGTAGAHPNHAAANKPGAFSGGLQPASAVGGSVAAAKSTAKPGAAVKPMVQRAVHTAAPGHHAWADTNARLERDEQLTDDESADCPASGSWRVGPGKRGRSCQADDKALQAKRQATLQHLQHIAGDRAVNAAAFASRQIGQIRYLPAPGVAAELEDDVVQPRTVRRLALPSSWPDED
jgi:hypothetical protein